MERHLCNVFRAVRGIHPVRVCLLPVLTLVLLLTTITPRPASANLISSGIMVAGLIARGVQPYCPGQIGINGPMLSPGTGEDEPLVIHREPVTYPEIAKRAGFEGTVELLVSVDRNGRVAQTKIIWSDASRILEAAAEEAAAKFIFRPARQYNLAVSCQVIVPFKFVLE